MCNTHNLEKKCGGCELAVMHMIVWVYKQSKRIGSETFE